MPSTANLKHYINIVKEKSMLRNIVHIAEYMENMGYDSESIDTPETVLDKAEQLLSKLTKNLLQPK